MNRFNAITSALFDPLLAPFGEEHAWFDLLFWSVAGGIVALIAHVLVDDQRGIQRTKNAINGRRLHTDHLGMFPDAELRMLQRRVKNRSRARCARPSTVNRRAAGMCTGVMLPAKQQRSSDARPLRALR